MNRSVLYMLIAGVAALAIWKLVPENGADDGGAMAKVIVPELSADAIKGKTRFDENCAACHGENAAGVAGSGPPLVHKIYEPNHHGDGAFFVAALNGVRQHHWPFGNMPPVEGIKKEQIAEIVTYVRELQKANSIF